jgi:hypothetical protein
MSHLISRILLAVLMIPAAGFIFLITILASDRTFGYSWRPMPMVMSGLSTWAFVAIYWFWLWRTSVKWTSTRIGWTGLAAIGAVIVGFMAGVLTYPIERDVGEFIGSSVAPLAWLIAVTIIWRETPLERAQRLGPISKTGIVCPKCGYNLTGLQGTRCPECGTQYTLDELLASQPSRKQEMGEIG